MSRARLVISAVVVEGRSQAEVARAYGVSPGWMSRLVARYRVEGEAAFQPGSRRPKAMPTATPRAVVDLVVRLRKELDGVGLDAGAHTIVWHLQHRHGIRVSPATVHRLLVKAGMVIPTPKKRPRSSYTRFEADLPNEMWQTGFTHVRLANGTDVEVLTFLDDHSRYALAVVSYNRVTGRSVVDTFRQAVATHGIPASVLSDNGMVFTTRRSPSSDPAS
jgi:transposase